MPHTVKVRLTTDKKFVILLNSIIDSYEGIGIVRTVDASAGSVVIYSTDSTYRTVLDVLNVLKRDGVKIEDICTQESENVDEW